MTDYDFHPLANAFPSLGEEALAALAADIELHGQLEPIVLFEGQILDGRQRWLACRMAGVEPRLVEWPGPGSPVAWVISKNLHRRHLNDSQRAMVAARLANLANGHRKRPAQSCAGERDVTLAEAAALLNVSPRSVQFARKLQAAAEPELQAAVDAGEVSLNDALGVADLPPDAQREALRAHRAGQARTLCAAATGPHPGPLPEGEGVAELCEAFARELGKLARRLDEIVLARGGDDEFTQLARRGLSIVKQAVGKMESRS